MTVYAGLLQSFGVSLRVAAEWSASRAASAIGIDFPASVADEHEFNLLLESRDVGDVGEGDAAAAKNADVGELVQVGQGDRAGLHAAH